MVNPPRFIVCRAEFNIAAMESIELVDVVKVALMITDPCLIELKIRLSVFESDSPVNRRISLVIISIFCITFGNAPLRISRSSM